MKTKFQHLILFFQALLIISTLSSFAQKTFTHIASKNNNTCNGDCTVLDIVGLNDNPAAIIMVTAVLDKGVNLNPHPIGVYYFKGKWNIMNLDQVAIPVGSKFNVEYANSPDQDHFIYSITKENLGKDGSSFIDLPALNNNPTAQFRSLLNWDPQRGGAANREATEINYNADEGKWVISNVNKKSLFARVSYNIVISFRGQTITNPVNNTATGNSVSGPIIGMYMTASANGIKIAGESNKSNHLDQTELVDFEMGASRPIEGSGRASSRKQYDPIIIKKYTGGIATIPYLNAFVKVQDLVVTIEAYSIASTGTGAEGLNYTIKLSGAHFSGFKQIYEEANRNYKQGYLDVIKITFTKIEFIKDGVVVEDIL